MDLKPFDISKLSGKSTFDPSQIGYEDSIDIIKDELRNTQKSFVKIGWYLKHIDENDMYIQDGYKDIFDFAMDKFGISGGTANRFINVCKEFSKGHDSPELDDKYCDYKVSQLFEMLPMKEDERDEITPDMSVKEIRETKEELKAKKEPSEQDIKAFYSNVSHYLPLFHNKKEIKEFFVNNYGKSYTGVIDKTAGIEFDCTPRGICINGSEEITWMSLANKLWDYVLSLSKETALDGNDNLLSEEQADAVPRHREMTNDEKQEYDELTENAEQMSFSSDKQIIEDRTHDEMQADNPPDKLIKEADDIAKFLYHAFENDYKSLSLSNLLLYKNQIKRLDVIIYELSRMLK